MLKMDKVEIKQEVEDITIEDVNITSAEESEQKHALQFLVKSCEVDNQKKIRVNPEVKSQIINVQKNPLETCSVSMPHSYSNNLQENCSISNSESCISKSIIQRTEEHTSIKGQDNDTQIKSPRISTSSPISAIQQYSASIQNYSNNSDQSKSHIIQQEQNRQTHTSASIQSKKSNFERNFSNENILSDYYCSWETSCGNFVSQLNNIFSENNKGSSDEEEDVIHIQINKMRMRNGLSPIDLRTTSQERKKAREPLKNPTASPLNTNTDSNGCNRSPPGDLVIDESAEDTTDTDSVVSSSSIFKKDIYKKRPRKAEDSPISSDTTNEDGIKLIRLDKTNFMVVNNDSRSKPKDVSNSRKAFSDGHLEGSTETSSSKAVAFEEIANTIKNIKRESNESISKEQSRSSSPLQPTSNNTANQQSPVFKCTPCKLRFDVHLDLKKHILSTHIKIYQCQNCPFRTLIPFQFQRHLHTHYSSKSSDSGSLSPIRIKQLSSSSSRSPTSSGTSSPLEIIELD